MLWLKFKWNILTKFCISTVGGWCWPTFYSFNNVWTLKKKWSCHKWTRPTNGKIQWWRCDARFEARAGAQRNTTPAVLDPVWAHLSFIRNFSSSTSMVMNDAPWHVQWYEHDHDDDDADWCCCRRRRRSIYFDVYVCTAAAIILEGTISHSHILVHWCGDRPECDGFNGFSLRTRSVDSVAVPVTCNTSITIAPYIDMGAATENDDDNNSIDCGWMDGWLWDDVGESPTPKRKAFSFAWRHWHSLYTHTQSPFGDDG